MPTPLSLFRSMHFVFVILSQHLAFCTSLHETTVVEIQPSSSARLVRRHAEHEAESHPHEKARVRHKNLEVDDSGNNHKVEAPPQEQLQSRCVVPGHTALPKMIQEAERAKHIENCGQVYDKAMTMTMSFKVANTEDPEPPWLTTLEQGLAATPVVITEQMSIDFVEKIIGDGNDPLGTGLTNGVLWTYTDMEVFKECAEGTPFTSQVLEEANAEMAEGDIAPTEGQGLPAMLIEAALHHKRAVNNLWPETSGGEHEIAYCFSSGASEEAQEGFLAAVQHIEKQIPCLKFKASTSSRGTNKFSHTDQENCADMPSIIVQSRSDKSAGGCWSHVGMLSDAGKQFKGSSQPINMDKGCGDMGIAAHEIGHAIGLLHEMSRNDRQKYLTINEAHIPESMRKQFENNTWADTTTDFDFLSLMMYGSYAFSSDGELTITPHDLRLVSFMGQRMGLSELDVDLIGSLYGCRSTITPLTQNAAMSKAYLTSEGIKTGHTGPCVDSLETGYVRKDGSMMPCDELKTYCQHTTLGPEIQELCPVACYMCTKSNQSIGRMAPAEKGAASRFFVSGLVAFLLALLV